METALICKPDDLRSIIKEAVRSELNKISSSATVNQEPKEGGIDFAQDVLQVYSKSTIYKMTSEGSIPYRKRGKTLWFNRADLEQWLDDGASTQRK